LVVEPIVILVEAKMVKVSFDLEEDLHKAIRKKAIDKGITMKAYIVELIERGKSMEEDESIA
jgi:predicted DNA binding CopG/RHH family protein